MVIKKILFITDSLGLPTLNPEPVLAEESWPYLLTSELLSIPDNSFSFYYHCLHGLTTDAVVDHLQGVLGAYAPDMVIIQVGIVDCYPRALKKNELALLSRLPLVNKIIHRLIKKYYMRLVASRNIHYVDIEKFENNSYRILNYYKNIEIAVIPIAPPNDAFVRKNPKVLDSISKYNSVLRRVYGQFYLDEMYNTKSISDLFLSDNYHLSVVGNRHVVDVLLEKYCHRFHRA